MKCIARIGGYLSVFVGMCMHLRVLTCIGKHLYLLYVFVCNDIYLYVLICNGLYWLYDMYWYVWYVLVCIGMH